MKLKNILVKYLGMFIFVACLVLASCKEDTTGVLLGGFDRQNGKAINAFIPTKDYIFQTEKIMNATVAETFAALEQIESQKNKRPLRFNKLAIGLSVSSAFGIGKVLNMEVEPGIEFVFKKHSSANNSEQDSE